MKIFIQMKDNKINYILIFLLLPVLLPAQQFYDNKYVSRADSLLNTIVKLFDVPKYGLLSETYPINPEQKITYTINDEGVKQQETSFYGHIQHSSLVVYLFIRLLAMKNIKNLLKTE